MFGSKKPKVTKAAAVEAAASLKQQPPTAAELGVDSMEPGTAPYVAVVPEEERMVNDFMGDGVDLDGLHVWDSTYIPEQIKDPHKYYRWVKFDPPSSTATYGKEAWWMSKGLRAVKWDDMEAVAKQARPGDWQHYWPGHWQRGPNGQIRMGDTYLYACPRAVHERYKRFLDGQKADAGQGIRDRFHDVAETLSQRTGYGVDTWEVARNRNTEVNYQSRALKGDSATGAGPKRVDRR